MPVVSAKKHFERLDSIAWVVAVLFIYSLLFFSKANRNDWIFTGDTLNSFAKYSYQYSGIARGEYPIWNPLVRAGESEEVQQALQLANPISNMVIIISLLGGVKDIVLSYSTYIFTLILLYVTGIYLLMYCWTDNCFAGAFASILAIGSSSVFFNAYHVSFIMILHAIPWMLYAATMYFRELKFKYLVIFALAYSTALYSYEFVMGLSYIIMLSVTATFFYHRQIRTSLRELSKIPVWHYFALGGILVIITSPAFFMFLAFREKLFPISRATAISVKDNYTIAYQNMFTRITVFPLFSKRFWLTLFTGFFTNSCEQLRQFVGPLTFPFLAIALFSLRKAVWCLALSGLFILCLAGDIFPANLLYKLPVLSQVRNGHFFQQFILLVIIMLAGFGLNSLEIKNAKTVFNLAAAFLLFISLAFLWRNALTPATHNWNSFLITAVSMLMVLFSVNLLPPKYLVGSFLFVATIITFSYTLLVDQLRFSGSSTSTPEILALRQRSDHSLQFRYVRPDTIDTIQIPDKTTSFGRDEFSSYVSLKDNSYKTLGGNFGLSSLPVLKSYQLFTSVPGSEKLMKNKFFFFRKCYTSANPSDMTAFKRNPKLLETMLSKGIGIVEQITTKNVSLGPFRPEIIKTLPELKGTGFDVLVNEYKANRLYLTVSVKHPGVFAYIDSWDQGWHVKLDSKSVPLKKVFHTFKGVEISPGTHEIEFYYKSISSVLIAASTLVFVFCILCLIPYTFRFPRHKDIGPSTKQPLNG